MKINLRTSLALLAGVALGAMAVQGLHAQATPPTYAVIDDSVITDPTGYAAIGPKGGPSVAAFGGKFVMRTDKITASDGTPPQRIIVIAFESLARIAGHARDLGDPGKNFEVAHLLRRRHDALIARKGRPQ